MMHSAAKRALRPALLVCCLAHGRAQVIVTPRCPSLEPGQSCTFEARLAPDPAAGPEEARWHWILPGEETGRLHPDTGVYTAPEVSEIRRVRVRACLSADPLVFGEATVTILPGEPFALVGKLLGPEWLVPFSKDYPFKDLATGQRFPGRGWVWDGSICSTWHKPVLTGSGLPCTLRWHAQPGARAELLSYREGDEVVQRDVTGKDAQEITPRSPVAACEVESLELLAGLERIPGGQHWRSQVQRLPVDVRGVFPFAGNTVAEGGHADGMGLSARFREPFDVVRVPAQDSFMQERWDLVVTDPRSHVLRRISAEGVVTTFSGQEGEPGHQDSPGLVRSLAARLCRMPATEPLWNRPTFLARYSTLGKGEGWELLVSDSGNHAIRRVSPGGKVETAAGTPGLAGHRDSDDPLQAQFNDPRGIGVSGTSTFVADRGNFVIRRIAAGGAVSTLAGSPGLAGTRDGTGADARFTDLKGLALNYEYGLRPFLFALDGHAVRKITFPEGVVTTVLGQVDTPGFLDVPEPGDAPELEARRLALRQPCLNDPNGIRSWDGILHIADRGNHALRKLELRTARLTTVAGAPELPEIRWGLLRDGIPGPLDARYAALAAPTAVTTGAHGPEAAQFVCTGRGLAQIRHGEFPRDAPEVTQLDCFPARRNEPVAVFFSIRTLDRHGEPTVQPFHYQVDFIESDGTLAGRKEGTESTARAVTLEGVLTQAGTATVLLRAVTAQGVSTGMKRTVQVQDEL
jgi:hypothetical protein